VLAIVLAEAPDDAPYHALTWRRIGALAAACAAVLSLAVGAVVWVVLAFMALRRGAADRPWLVLLVTIGCVFFTVYLHGLTLEDSAGSLTAASVVKAADYFLTFLGLPWARAAPEVGKFIGAAMLALSLLAFARTSARRSSRHERIALALILFSIGAAFLAALGRQNVTDDVALPGRYTILLVPMKAGLILLALPWIDRRRAAHKRIVEAGVAALFAVCLAQQVVIGRIVVASAAHLRETIADFRKGERTEAMKTLIHPNLEHAKVIQTEIDARGVYAQP
jgi:hypothetical protein